MAANQTTQTIRDNGTLDDTNTPIEEVIDEDDVDEEYDANLIPDPQVPYGNENEEDTVNQNNPVKESVPEALGSANPESPDTLTGLDVGDNDVAKDFPGEEDTRVQWEERQQAIQADPDNLE